MERMDFFFFFFVFSVCFKCSWKTTRVKFHKEWLVGTDKKKPLSFLHYLLHKIVKNSKVMYKHSHLLFLKFLMFVENLFDYYVIKMNLSTIVWSFDFVHLSLFHPFLLFFRQRATAGRYKRPALSPPRCSPPPYFLCRSLYRYGWSWAYLSRSYGALRYGAAKSRQWLRRLGLEKRLYLQR